MFCPIVRLPPSYSDSLLEAVATDDQTLPQGIIWGASTQFSNMLNKGRVKFSHFNAEFLHVISLKVQ